MWFTFCRDISLESEVIGMNDEVIEIPMNDGLVRAEDVARGLADIGAISSGDLMIKIGKLRDIRAGSYPPQEALESMSKFVDDALFAIVTALAVVELTARSDGQTRNISVNLIEQS